ncbi:proton-conducting membrane transporter [Alkaliphilus serpentinus]|uniref:Proton-conducting membrane transporter n=1 Tax=Alkaliphilus serpentinus TaxID=1482731 RepID=A0A833HLB7_9FIRM|nr:proton-conducting membrane transporter [Alkaliphilus serpentinus]
MDLINKIKEAGVVGAGGAGFPTHVKINCKADTFIINAAECEPLLSTDQYLMREKSQDIIEAINEVANHVGARRRVIAIKKKYTEEIKSLQQSLHKNGASIELYLLDNFFPAGDEQIMVYEVTGRIVPEGGIPLDVDTVVSNVGTMVNIKDAILGKAVINKYVTIIGEVNEPKLLRVPIGAAIIDCIKEAGGAKEDDYSVVLGGPMMGRVLDQEKLKDQFITKTVGAVIILPKDHYIINRNKTPIQHIINQAKSACIQCRYCTDLCPRYLIGHRLRPHLIMGAISTRTIEDEVFQEAMICCECGICELYACPMGLSPRIINAYLKNYLRQKNFRPAKFDGELQANEARDYRKIPTDRLMAKINVQSYSHQKFKRAYSIKVSSVGIPLKQHIGVMSEAIVALGDWVEEGQMIGRVPDGKLGANVHASISGVIMEIGDIIRIQEGDGG